MTKLPFTERETELLADILDEASRHLDVELRRTDSLTYRHELRNRLHAVDRLTERVRESIHPVTEPHAVAQGRE
jgi:hypothetical protein